MENCSRRMCVVFRTVLRPKSGYQTLSELASFIDVLCVIDKPLNNCYFHLVSGFYRLWIGDSNLELAFVKGFSEVFFVIREWRYFFSCKVWNSYDANFVRNREPWFFKMKWEINAQFDVKFWLCRPLFLKETQSVRSLCISSHWTLVFLLPLAQGKRRFIELWVSKSY